MNFANVGKWIEKLPRLNLTHCALVLLGTVLVAFAVVAGFAYQRHGSAGVTAAAVAAAICWVAATLALVTSALVRGPLAGLYAMLLGMFFRLGLPLGTGLVLTNRGGPLAEAGVFGLILIFYLLTLAVETPLSLSILSSSRRNTKVC